MLQQPNGLSPTSSPNTVCLAIHTGAGYGFSVLNVCHGAPIKIASSGTHLTLAPIPRGNGALMSFAPDRIRGHETV